MMAWHRYYSLPVLGTSTFSSAPITSYRLRLTANGDCYNSGNAQRGPEFATATVPSHSLCMNNGHYTGINMCECGNGYGAYRGGTLTSGTLYVWVKAPSCSDGVANGNESDVDCGDTCAPCAVGKTCR